MSKNTGTSELINYFDLGVNGDVGIAGSLDINTIANATTDTDTFLVSDTGIIKYRTGAQLLSDIGAQAAGNYVTLDTAQSITGVKTFNTGSLILAAAGTANSTHLRNSAGDSTSVGGSNAFGFNSSNNIYVSTQSKGGFILDFNNSTSNKIYTLQDASGTLAFTSQIPTVAGVYLPLAGGTLTGALNGTSASFTGAVTSDDLILTAGTLFGAGNTGFSNRLSDTTLYLQMPATGFNITDNALNTRFTLASTGAATFSSSVTVGGDLVSNGGAGATRFIITSAGAGDGLGVLYNASSVAKIQLYANGVSYFNGGNVLIGTTTDAGYKLDVNGTGRFSQQLYLNSASGLVGDQGYLFFNYSPSNSGSRSWKISNDQNAWGDFVIQSSATQTGAIVNTPLSIASTGAATFSSSVTATSFNLGNGQFLRLTRSSGALQYDALGIVAGTDNTRLISTGDFDIVSGALASQFKVTASGNVGINTINPAGQLSGTKGLSIVDASNAALGLSNGTNHWLNYLSGTTYRIWNNSVAEVMTLTYGGNVLIGTTTDNGYKLRVNGGTQASSFNTDSGTILMATYSTFTTFYTVSNYQNAIYLVTLQLNGYSNYTAYATICQNDSGLVIMNQVNNVAYIQVSGLNIQGSQNSGASQNMVWKIIKIS